MIGAYVQVYEDDEWRLGLVVGWDAKKKEHVLMNAANEFFSLFIGDFFHFFRTGDDVQRELTWGKLRIVKAIETDTLLMQSAAEDEAEDELILPEGFFTRKKDTCEVGDFEEVYRRCVRRRILRRWFFATTATAGITCGV